MKGRGALGVGLGFVGLAVLLAGVWGVIDAGSCDASTQTGCSADGGGSAIVGILAGTFLLVLGEILGRGVGWTFMALPAFAAMLLTKAFVDRPAGERTGLLVAGGILAAITASAVVAMVRVARRSERARRLTQTGHKARGRLSEVRDTGTTINDDPRVELTFDVEPLDGSTPWQVAVKRLVPRTEIPRRGEVFPIWYDPAAPREQWTVVLPSDRPLPVKVLREFGIESAGVSDTPDARLGALERLGRLRDQGVLDEYEFEAEKRRILSDGDGF